MTWSELWNSVLTGWDMLWTGAKPFLPGLFELWWVFTIGTIEVVWTLLWAFIG